MEEFYEKSEVITSHVVIDGITVPTRSVTFYSANLLQAETGTTGYGGGDSGHGGRTYFRLKDLGSTDIRVRINNGEWHSLMSEGPVELAFGGDCELDTFIAALGFAVQTLKERITED